MKIIDLVIKIQDNYIKSEHLHAEEMIGFMDSVIDDINDDLQAIYPIFSEYSSWATAYNDVHAGEEGFVPLDPTNYTLFPDRYLRTVVAPGTAVKFYTNDEEGDQTSAKFFSDYMLAKIIMQRDYMDLVPTIFQNTEGGFVTTSCNGFEDYEASVEGIVIDNAYTI